MVSPQPSTAISCVDAKNIHIKNVIASRWMFGFLEPSSLPNQSSIFIDMIISIAPTVHSKIQNSFSNIQIALRSSSQHALPIKYCVGTNHVLRLPIFLEYTQSTSGAHKILKQYEYVMKLNSAWKYGFHRVYLGFLRTVSIFKYRSYLIHVRGLFSIM